MTAVSMWYLPYLTEGVKMQCGREYFPDDERKPRVTQLYRMTSDKREKIPMENQVAEHLVKFGYLASISAARSNKNSEAKRIGDDLMFSTEDNDGKVLKSTNKIIKSLKDMELKWTDEQCQILKETVASNLRKRAGDNYREILLQKCKEHKGPIVNVKELKMLVKQCGDDQKKSKRFLRQEIAFKKVMHPVAGKSDNSDGSDIELEEILFPTEEENIEQILDAPIREDTDANDQTISFRQLQPLAVCDGDTRYWCVALI